MPGIVKNTLILGLREIKKFGDLGHFLGNWSLKVYIFLRDGRRQYAIGNRWHHLRVVSYLGKISFLDYLGDKVGIKHF